jgi:tetratricopeptide (TPR) repeat protein
VRGRARLASSLAFLCVLSVACVSALKEPRPLGDLAGLGAGSAPPASPEEIAALLSRATTLFAERDVDTTKTAAQLFLRAAAADAAPIEAVVGAVRAQIWLTDHAGDAGERLQAATFAVEAAQWCGRRQPPDPQCDYWLGAALGVQARERPSTGLSALPKIEELFRRAAQAIPTLEEAGPERALALLYVRAPGWPSGPGDPDLGLKHARAAVELRPDYPPNRLALAEALAATGDADAARLEYRRALDHARAMADSGDRDAAEWVAEAGKGLGEAGAG